MNAAPTTAEAMFYGSAPWAAKFTRPRENMTNAEASKPMPARSSLIPVLANYSLRYLVPTAAANMPIGMFMKKMYCQLMR